MGKIENMALFVTIVETGSLSKAAQRLNIAKSAVSRRLGELEEDLACQLLKRTTRQLSLTPEGRIYFERAKILVNEVQELNNSLANDDCRLSGKLRLSIPLSFGQQHIAPALIDFLKQHPDLELDVDLSDRRVNLIDEGFDMAIRIGQLEDSSLISRKIAPIKLMLVASPDYIEKFGEPETVEDLKARGVFRYSYASQQKLTMFDKNNKEHIVRVESRLTANNGDFLKLAAVAGVGISIAPSFLVWQELAEGRVVHIMKHYTFRELSAVAVYPPSRHISGRIRRLIDFFAHRFGSHPYWDQSIGYGF